MPEPIVVAIIAAVSAFLGALSRPWGQDYVNRKQHERDQASRREKEAADEARYQSREAAARESQRREDRRQRLRDINAAIAGVSGNSMTSTDIGRFRATRTAAAEVRDTTLTDAIGRMQSSEIQSSEWNDAAGDALHRIGELSGEIRDA